MRQVIEASEAVALGAKLCRPHVIPMYPITPQTHIVERLADYINDGDLDSELIHVESEHSALSAAIGSVASGGRAFTASSSQGIALMHEIIFIASGMRLPMVMAVANRALSAPINIWNDHTDTVAERDSGWIQLYVESAQEALDTVIMAFKVGEDSKIMLPVMVCLDGFTLSHVYEPVDIPEQSKVNSFLPSFKPKVILDPSKPVTMGPIAFPDSFMHFKKQQQEAMDNALKVISDVNQEFSVKFKRSYGDGLVDAYRMEDAKYAIVAMGTVCGTARVAVDELRRKGRKIGLIKIKSLRPFPAQALLKLVKNVKALAVVDRAISLGHEGPLCTDLRSVLQKSKVIINNFIMGLGGKDVTLADLVKIGSNLDKQQAMQWVLE